MKDIVDRLHSKSFNLALCLEAAAEIAALRAERERLQSWLRTIRDMPEAPGAGWYAEGYNAARADAVEMAREALGDG